MHYIAFIHKDGDSSFGISFPDFPGCISAGDTFEKTMQQGREALSFHAEGLLEDGAPLPLPRSLDNVMADASLDEWRDEAAIAFVPLLLDRGSPKRVNISIDIGLLQAIDDTAKARGMNRSAFLASAARKEIEAVE